MAKYDASLFDPPAPLARVVLRSPENIGDLTSASMLLDSGADVTLIPSTAASQMNLNANANEVYELMSFDGSRTLASAVHLEMIFLNKIFRGRFLLIDRELGVIGRDILNLISLSLDGPNLVWSEQEANR